MRIIIKILIIIFLIPLIIYPDENIAKQQIQLLATKIKRAFPKPPTESEKKRIAIAEFENIGENVKAQNIGKGVTEVITNELASSGVFIVIERSQLNKVLGELKLQLTGLVVLLKGIYYF